MDPSATSKLSPIAKAINAVVAALTTEVISAIEREIEVVVDAEVDAILADIPNRVRARLVGPQPAAPVALLAPEQERESGPAPGEVVDVEYRQPEPAPNLLTPRQPKPRAPRKAAHQPEPEQTVERKPRLTVVGLHPRYSAHIGTEFGDCFDLRFWAPDQLAEMKRAIHAGERTIVATDYVGHKHIDVLKAANADIHLVAGGVSRIKSTITELFVNGSQQ